MTIRPELLAPVVVAVVACVSVVLGLLAALRALEPRLLFGRPKQLRPGPAGPHHGRHLTLEQRLVAAPGTELVGVLARPLRDAFGGPGTRARTTLLWFGGRNEDVRWTPAIAGWLGEDYAVASFAYRGLLGGRGRPSERRVVDDALHVIEHLAEESQLHGTRLLLAGRSLGSAVALQVAARLGGASRPAGLVLLSPMDSVRALARRRWWLAPWWWAVHNAFDSVAAAHHVTCPVLVLLADEDAHVPHANSWRLVHALRQTPGATRVEVRRIPGTDHRTLPRSPAALTALARFADSLDP